MWRSGWFWFRSLRKSAVRGRLDLADMGIDIGLDESLESVLPPLMGDAVNWPQAGAGRSQPLGTDLRSQLR